jgi:hypothetical protein
VDISHACPPRLDCDESPDSGHDSDANPALTPEDVLDPGAQIAIPAKK